MQAKMKSKKGFTLVEMLIVVAIIAILVAIAIPVYSTQMEKAKIAVDQANRRTCESIAVAEFMLAKNHGGTPDDATTPTKYTYYFKFDETNNSVTLVASATGAQYQCEVAADGTPSAATGCLHVTSYQAKHANEN